MKIEDVVANHSEAAKAFDKFVEGIPNFMETDQAVRDGLKLFFMGGFYAGRVSFGVQVEKIIGLYQNTTKENAANG